MAKRSSIREYTGPTYLVAPSPFRSPPPRLPRRRALGVEAPPHVGVVGIGLPGQAPPHVLRLRALRLPEDSAACQAVAAEREG